MAHIMIALLLFAFFFVLLDQSEWADYLLPQYEETGKYTEASWILEDGETVLNSQVTLPAFMHLQKGRHYRLSANLTYDASQDKVPFAFFYIHHMYCRAYLDGQELFSYMPEDIHKLDHSRSPGNIYASFPMPEETIGKEFVIEFIPPLNTDIDYELPYPVFGDYPTVAFQTFKNDLPHNIIALLSGFMGIVSIIFSTLVLNDSEYREGLFIGVFAVLFGIYNITECTFNFYLISNPYYTYILNYTAFSLVPVFMIAFIRERLDPGQKPFAAVLVVFSATLFGVEMILHFTGAVDLREFLPILHIAYFSEITAVFIMLIRMKQKQWKKHLILQMLPILVGMLLDAAVYYRHWTISKSDAAFTTVGVVIFLIFELYRVWQRSIEIYTESIRSRDYHVMAFIDALTGIGNRRAFEDEAEKIRNGKRTFETLFVVSADVNNLKIANDTLGHASGDFLIRSTANVLTELTAGQGIACRTGGDEFIAFLYNLDQQEFDLRLSQLREEIIKINLNSKVKLSLALGYEKITGNEIDKAIQSADQKMYHDKAESKAKISAAHKDVPEIN